VVGFITRRALYPRLPYSAALVDQAWAIVHTEKEKLSLIPWCTMITANYCSRAAHATTLNNRRLLFTHRHVHGSFPAETHGNGVL